MKITIRNKIKSPNLAAIIELDGVIYKEKDHNLTYFKIRDKYKKLHYEKSIKKRNNQSLCGN